MPGSGQHLPLRADLRLCLRALFWWKHIGPAPWKSGGNSWKASVLEAAVLWWVGGCPAQLPRPGGGTALRCGQQCPRGPSGPELQVLMAVTR